MNFHLNIRRQSQSCPVCQIIFRRKISLYVSNRCWLISPRKRKGKMMHGVGGNKNRIDTEYQWAIRLLIGRSFSLKLFIYSSMSEVTAPETCPTTPCSRDFIYFSMSKVTAPESCSSSCSLRGHVIFGPNKPFILFSHIMLCWQVIWNILNF